MRVLAGMVVRPTRPPPPAHSSALLLPPAQPQTRPRRALDPFGFVTNVAAEEEEARQKKVARGAGWYDHAL